LGHDRPTVVVTLEREKICTSILSEMKAIAQPEVYPALDQFKKYLQSLTMSPEPPLWLFVQTSIYSSISAGGAGILSTNRRREVAGSSMRYRVSRQSAMVMLRTLKKRMVSAVVSPWGSGPRRVL
jgi:hypothetical protein